MASSNNLLTDESTTEDIPAGLYAMAGSRDHNDDMYVVSTINGEGGYLALLDTGAIKNNYVSAAYAEKHHPDKIYRLEQPWRTSLGGFATTLIERAVWLTITISYGGVAVANEISCHLLPQQNEDPDNPALIIGLPCLRRTSFKDVFLKKFLGNSTDVEDSSKEVFLALLAILDPVQNIPGPRSGAPLTHNWPISQGEVHPYGFTRPQVNEPAPEDNFLEENRPRESEDIHEINAYKNLHETLTEYAEQNGLPTKDMDASGADLDTMGNYLANIQVDRSFKSKIMQGELQASLNTVATTDQGKQPWWKQSKHVLEAIQEKAYQKRLEDFREKVPDSLGDMIPDERRQEWIDLLLEYTEVFVSKYLRVSNTEAQELIFKEGKPSVWKSTLRSVPQAKQIFVEQTIKYYAETHQWKRGEAYFLHSFVAVMKPNTHETGLLRLAIDFKECLNKWLKPISQFVKNVPEVIGNMKGCRVAIFMDLEKAFHQVRMTEESLRYCGVLTSMGNFVPTGLPEGITVASQLLARVVELAYGPLKHLNVHALQDGIIIGAKDLDTLKETLIEVFKRTNKVNLQFGLGKCGFGVSKFEFFGLDVELPKDGSNAHTTISDKNVESLMKLPAPTDLKTGMQAMGIAVFHSTHIPSFSTVVQGIQALLKRDVQPTAEQLEAAEKSWEKVKEEVKKKHKVYTPDYSEDAKFILRTDWSADGYGFVLINGTKRQGTEEEYDYWPVMYGARSNSPAAKNYPAFKGELLAVVYALTKCEHLLMGRTFLLQTDNDGVSQAQKSTQRVIRNWLVYIGGFDMIIQHIPGKTNIVADALSRMPKEKLSQDEGSAAVATLVTAIYEEQLTSTTEDSSLGGDGRSSDAVFQHIIARVCSINTTLVEEVDGPRVEKTTLASFQSLVCQNPRKDTILAYLCTELQKLPDDDRVKKYLMEMDQWNRDRTKARREKRQFDLPKPIPPAVNEQREQEYIREMCSDGDKLMTEQEAIEMGLFGSQRRIQDHLNHLGFVQEDHADKVMDVTEDDPGLKREISNGETYIVATVSNLEIELASDSDSSGDESWGEESDEVIAERLGIENVQTDTILERLHGKSHIGAFSLYCKLKRTFPGIQISQQEVMQFINNCRVCQDRRSQTTTLSKYVMKHALPIRKDENVMAVDVLSMPKDRNDNSYILTLVNLLTKFVFAYPMKDKSTRSVIEGILAFSCLYYVPHRLRLDTDAALVAKDLLGMCQTMGILREITLIDRPEASGAERTNGKLVSYFRQVCMDDPKAVNRWSDPDLWYPALSVLNSLDNDEIGMTAKEAEWGSTFMLRHALDPEAENIPLERAQQIKKRVDHCRKVALQVITKHQEKRRKAGRKKEVRYMPGDHVFYVPNNRPTLGKLQSRTTGPHRVIHHLGASSLVEMIDYATNQVFRRHVRRLTPVVMTKEEAIASRMEQAARIRVQYIVGFRQPLHANPKALELITCPYDSIDERDFVEYTVYECLCYPAVLEMLKKIPLFRSWVDINREAMIQRYLNICHGATYGTIREQIDLVLTKGTKVLVSVLHPALSSEPAKLIFELREHPNWYGIDEREPVKDNRIFSIYFTGIVTDEVLTTSTRVKIAVNAGTDETGSCWTILSMTPLELMMGVEAHPHLPKERFLMKRNRVEDSKYLQIPKSEWPSRSIPGKYTPSQLESDVMSM